MATHTVKVDIPPRELNRADAVFTVKRDGKKYGNLNVSNGSVVWFPPYTSYGYKIGWKRFHELMTQEASRFEKRLRRYR